MKSNPKQKMAMFRSFLSLGRSLMTFALLVLALVPPTTAQRNPSSNDNNNEPTTPVQAALAFLDSQTNTTTGLLDSLVEDDVSYLYTYDQALAAMAYMASHQIDKAQAALDALTKLKPKQGGFYHRYMADSGRASVGANLRVGHNAYILQAFNMYFAYTAKRRYFKISKQVAAFLQAHQDATGAGRPESLDGGLFGDATAPWKSAENNLSAYVALYNYARIDSSAAAYRTTANHIQDFLLQECWDTTQKRFWTGKNDRMISSDVNALGVMVFGKDYESALVFTEETTVLSYEYSKEEFITGFDINVDKDTVWTEGTLQMSLAYSIVGETYKAQYCHDETIKVQKQSGGFLQAVVEGSTGHGENFLPWQAVAPTAWFVLADYQVNPLEIWT